MKETELPLYWTTQFFRKLYELGLKTAVISPGSRSTPLVLALSALNDIEKIAVLDERSAAFMALGIAKTTTRPVALICTSGTAVANYLPAVVEARQSGIPLIVVTADRPPSLQKIGASQSIPQDEIFGSYPVFSFNPGLPSADKKEVSRLQTAAEQLYFFSMNRCGPVHINFPFRKPLEPEPAYYAQVKKENKQYLNAGVREHSVKVHQQVELNDTIWSDIVSAERPVIIAGPAHPSQKLSFIPGLAARLQAPVLAEPGSGLPSHNHIIEGFDGFLRSEENYENLNADLILRFGRQPVSKATNQYLEYMANQPQYVFHEPDFFADETLSASKYIPLKGDLKIPEISGSASKDWLEQWTNISRKFSDYRASQLDETSLTDGLVFSEVQKHFESTHFVMLSNSFPVRDMMLFNDYHQSCFVNRGASGIDGILSTTLGISLAGNRPGVLFIGDLAFLHDSNALQQAHRVKKPLLVVLLNNGGGTIFRMLPVFELKSVYETYFETPQNVSFAHLCRSYDVNHTLITRTNELAEAIESEIKKPGVNVLECITDVKSSMDLRDNLWDFKL